MTNVPRAEVARYLRDHAPDRVYLKDIVEALYQDTAVRSKESCVQSAMWNLINVDKLPITVHNRGQCWSWDGKAEAATAIGGRLFAELRTTKTGRILVEGEDGTIYWLTEVQ